MNEYLKKLISNFNGKNYKEFAGYVYTTLQKEVDKRKNSDKDKYIKIQKSILQYVISNERAITSELRKVKK
jgi:hypothetical protein